MIFLGYGHDPHNELQKALDKTRDVVTDDILNEERQKADREIKKIVRRSNKARAFNRKNKRRHKRGRK